MDGSADGGDGGAVLVTPPDIPWLEEGVPPVVLAPCPEGWREVHGGDVVECDPYPEGGAEPCDAGEAHFPGEPGCRPIGAACPAGDYATSVPSSGPVVHVNAGAAAGGDGSLTAPYAALGEVPWVSLSAGTTVALGKGTYPGTLPLKAGVAVVGACTRETVVTGLAAPVPSVVSVTNAGEAAAVENLTIRGAPQNGVLVGSGRSLSLRGVLIERATGVGVISEGAGTHLSLSDVVIRDMEAALGAAFEFGFGVRVQTGGALEATRLILANNRTLGVSVTNAESTATLTDTVVRHTRPNDTNGRDGRGINVELGGHLDATRLFVFENRSVGVFAMGRGSTVNIVDAVIEGTEAQASDGTGGEGIVVEGGAALTANRLLVANNRQIGIFLNGAATTSLLTGAVIRDTEPQMRGMSSGQGMVLQEGARCEATGLIIAGNTEVSLFALDPGTVVSVTDALIHHTAPAAVTAGLGLGVVMQDGARFDARRLVVADNRAVGVYLTGAGASADLSDVVIRDTQPQASDLRNGRGIQAQEGAAVDGRRVEVTRSRQLAVAAVAGANVVFEDISVRDVEVAACVATTCPGAEYGYGVGAYSASLALTRFLITDAALCGVMVSSMEGQTTTASLDLQEGVVSLADIGACVQVPGYDFDRLTNDVEYRDNGTNLDSTTLPVPGAVDLAEP